MECLTAFVQWFGEHWKGLLTAAGGVAGRAQGCKKLIKEWKEARQTKLNRYNDARVFESLSNRDLWIKTGRPMTGGGDPLVRSIEIAEALSLKHDVVTDSLERLEARGKVRNAGGTLDNPAPYWHVLHR